MPNPHNYLRFLRDEEYVVPNEVFDAYARTVDKRPEWLGNLVGGYLPKNYLDTKEEKRELIERLRKLNLSEDEISIYYTLFTRHDIILFRVSILKDGLFEKVLPHERFHKEMKRLSKEDYRYMRKVAKEMLDRREDYPVLGDIWFVREKDYPGKKSYGFYFAAATMHWEEFYTYLAQGEFEKRVEEALKTDYPKAYQIFNKIREQTKLG